MQLALKLANLSLLLLFPVAWFAPLLRAGLLPLFGLSEISVISGLQELWGKDVFLALLVTAFALFAPYLKTIGLALLHFGLMHRKVLPALQVLGKLAMADIFLISLYIVVAKGIGVGRVEVAWGLYLFTACILASIAISWATEKSRKRLPPPRPAATLHPAAEPVALSPTAE
ncbi:MAG: paraquat-inducible protein A [Vannielia sp.]|uniref:paraquat-inducible protein A n=1 Tax=Rhodobacterales TaxID=204455 RepID=UPI0020955582|nr:paraquat-inducible protein A [Oceanicola sp. 502str15]MCO6381697.1 paraquat-inducible membrane protein A [Oceanicola sp. 502str15]